LIVAINSDRLKRKGPRSSQPWHVSITW
jgi:hypothetical protein